ncbi:protein LOWER TEMPERATURE 1-like [Curcuma longa]|uniref:protein LOWER TEMPERATURE 1-like n=1 Tax=Curcuma longa TaxID=136217 RepID=UPI003D9F49DE
MDLMEIDVSPPSRTRGAAAQPAGAASKHLFGLPSRGFFSSPVLSSNPGGMRVYVCERETAPPEGQVIETDTTNILIRALQINNLKNATFKSSTDGCTSKRSFRTSEGRVSPKKMKNNSMSITSHQGSSSTEFSEKTLQTMTVETLRTLLKDRGFSPKGRKDELIARLKGSDEP